MATPLHRYHFNLGNSHTGTVGACCEVMAESRQDAVAVLRKSLGAVVILESEHAGLEHLTCYLNPANVTDADIDTVDVVDRKERT